jgi:hypothetical protein
MRNFFRSKKTTETSDDVIIRCLGELVEQYHSQNEKLEKIEQKRREIQSKRYRKTVITINGKTVFEKED